LLQPTAIRALRQTLLPLATLATPNLDEAELLLGRELRARTDLPAAARELHERFGCAVLVKGGHLRGDEAVDVFFDGRTLREFVARRIRGVSTHGTGCTYSAAIAAGLARGDTLPRAVARAKEFVTRAIAGSRRIGRHFVLHSGGPTGG
jgi:hydroxymethylpyrimidine/phosphomethylpyrimidine kinase